MLNVSQIRLRFISARLLASVPSICKSVGGAGYLLRRTAKKCPQRIEDTPAGVFCALLAVSERTGMSVVINSSEICVMHKSRR